MSHYILIRRLRGPAFLLLVGVNALLNQAGILSWGQSWPFYLILWGVLALAERAALASEEYPQYPPYPGTQQPGWPPQPPAGPNAATPQAPGAAQTPGAQTGSAVVPTIPLEVIRKEGDQQ